jgi:hypothetical protein
MVAFGSVAADRADDARKIPLTELLMHGQTHRAPAQLRHARELVGSQCVMWQGPEVISPDPARVQSCEEHWLVVGLDGKDER